MYKRSHVNVKVEPRFNFTFKLGTLYVVSILFTRVKFTYVYTKCCVTTGDVKLDVDTDRK